MKNKYLPIGTIVFIKENISPFLISGYFNKNSKGEVIDYICVPFPYGLMKDNFVYFFNHDDIEKIIYTGYVDEKYYSLNKILNRI